MQFLYFSRVQGDKPFETIAAVVSEARRLHAERAVTGVLVFDGAHALQYVEGDVAVIDALIERLEADPRHESVQVLHQGLLDGSRRFARWCMGYLLLDDGQDLTRFKGLSGPAAVQALLDQLPRVDLDP